MSKTWETHSIQLSFKSYVLNIDVQYSANFSGFNNEYTSNRLCELTLNHYIIDSKAPYLDIQGTRLTQKLVNVNPAFDSLKVYLCTLKEGAILKLTGITIFSNGRI